MEKREYEVMYQVEDTHFWFKGMRSIVGTIIGKLPISPGSNILDAGCGTGMNLGFLKRFGNVVGLDLSAHAVSFAKSRGFKATRGSIDHLPYPDNSFDLITSHNVIDESSVDEQAAFAEFRRVLKPGGYLLIIVPAYQWLLSSHDYYFGTDRRYTVGSLIRLMRSHKLKIVRSTYANTLLFPVAALKRLLRKYIPSLFQKNTSDVMSVPPILNFLLYLPLLLESQLLRYFDLPFGLSVIVVAQKKNK